MWNSSGSVSAIRWPRTRYAWISSTTRAVLSIWPSEVVRDVADPAHRLVRDAQRGEDLVVEAVLAEQQLVHHLEELAGLGALDDPVVVGAESA